MRTKYKYLKNRFVVTDIMGNPFLISEIGTMLISYTHDRAPQELDSGLSEYETESGKKVMKINENEFYIIDLKKEARISWLNL